MITKQNAGTVRLRLLASGVAMALALSATAPAYATIDNTATAGGTFNATPVTSPGVTENVDVEGAGPALTATKAFVSLDANVIGDSDLQPGDTITYTITVDNTGNVTMTDITPDDDGITFGAAAGTGAYAYSPATVASLAPADAPTVFTVTYTLTEADIYNGAAAGTNGVDNSAHATGTYNSTPTDSPVSGPVETTIPADPELVVAKTGVLTKAPGNTGADAEVGDTITYTYTVNNTGNVAIDDVTIADIHEGAPLPGTSFIEQPLTLVDGILANSTDAAIDNSWDLLGPGASVQFTYAHTVTQAEFDAQ